MCCCETSYPVAYLREPVAIVKEPVAEEVHSSQPDPFGKRHADLLAIVETVAVPVCDHLAVTVGHVPVTSTGWQRGARRKVAGLVLQSAVDAADVRYVRGYSP